MSLTACGIGVSSDGPFSCSGGDIGDSRTGSTVLHSSIHVFCFLESARHFSLSKYLKPSLGVEGGTVCALLGPASISSCSPSVVIIRPAMMSIGLDLTSSSILLISASVFVDQSESQSLDTSSSLSLEM